MTITLPSGLYWPFSERRSPNFNSVVIDATAEKVCVIGHLYLKDRNPLAKTLDTTGSSAIKIFAAAATWATAGSTIDVGIQGVNVASGPPWRPDGSFSVKKTLTQGTDAISGETTITAVPDTGTVTLSHGDLIAIVADFTNRAGADSLSVGTATVPSGVSQSSLPGGAHFTGSWAGQNPISAAIIFSDGTVGWIDGLVACGSLVAATWADATNPDERGNIFQVPFNTKVDQLWTMMRTVDAGSDFTITLYSDPEGTPTAIAQVVWDGERTGTAGTVLMCNWPIDPAVSLIANTDYCIAVKATGGSNIRNDVTRLLSGTGDMRQMFPGGTTIRSVSRNNSTGAFGSSSNELLYSMGIRLNEIPGDTIVVRRS